MATNLGTAIGYLTLDITGFTRGIDEATRQMDRMGTSSSSALANIGTSISKVGTALTATVTAPIIGFGTSILREGTTFEEAMTKVKNVANLANSDINTFRQAVADLGFQMTETGNDSETMFKTMYNYAVNQGSQTRYTAEEVASALYYMGLAGWDATKMMQGLRPVLDLAAATGEDLARVSDIVTDSMNALGIEVKDLSSYTNVLAEMTRSSNTTLDQAGEAFKYVAPLAGALGYTMQDLAIAIGEFANVGVKGSQAGTGLRQALNSLTNPSDRAKEVMDRLNWSMYDMYGNAKPLMQVMTELRQMFGDAAGDTETIEAFGKFAEYLEEIGASDAFDNMSMREQIEMFSEWASTAGVGGEKVLTEFQKVSDVIKLVGIRALPGMLGIINATDENFNTLANSVYGADKAYNGLGTSVGMADELMDTTQGSIYKLTSSISELRIQLFEFLQGPFQQVIDKLTEAIKWFNGLDDATQKNILSWAGIAAAVGPVLLVIGKLLTAIAQISTGFKLAGISKDGFAKNMTGTLKPAVEGGTGTVTKFGTVLKTIGEAFAKVLKVIGGVGSIIGGVVAVVVGVVDAIKNGYDIIHAILITLGAALAALGAILLGAPAAITAIVAAIVAVVANLVAAIGANWDKVKAGLAKAWDAIVNFFSSIGKAIGDFVSKAVSVVGNFLSNLWSGFTEFIGNVFSNVGTFFSNIISSAGQFFSNLFSNIGSALSNIWNSVSQWFSNLISNIGSWFAGIFDNLRNLLSSVLDLVTSIGQAIWQGISNVFSMVFDGISQLASFFVDIFSSLLNGVMTALSSIGSAISGFIAGIVETISNTISTIVEFIAGLAHSIGEALTGVFNTIKGFFDAFINSLSNVLTGIGSWISGVISELGGFIKTLWENIIQIVSDFGSGIAEVLSSIGKGISELVGDIGKGIADFLKGIADKIKNGISGIVDGIKNGFANIWQQVYDIGKNIITGIYEGLKAGVTWLGDGLGNICNGIVDGVKRVLKIGSPSKVFADEVGRWIPPGIAEGFEDAMPDAEDDINDSIDDLIEGVNADDVDVNIGTSYNKLQTVLTDSYTSFADAVETTEQRLDTSLNNMYEKMYNLMMLNRELTDGIISNTGYNVSTGTNGSTGNGGDVNTSTTGNTFIFNSPKAIDEIEAARQLEKTQRELEEGFI